MELTPEQQEDINARVASFKTDYLALTEKHEVDFIAYPELVPNEKGLFGVISQMTIIDKKYAPQGEKNIE